MYHPQLTFLLHFSRCKTFPGKFFVLFPFLSLILNMFFTNRILVRTYFLLNLWRNLFFVLFFKKGLRRRLSRENRIRLKIKAAVPRSRHSCIKGIGITQAGPSTLRNLKPKRQSWDIYSAYPCLAPASGLRIRTPEMAVIIFTFMS